MDKDVLKLTAYDFAKEGVEESRLEILTRLAIKIHAEAVLQSPFDLGQLRNSLMWRTAESEGGFNSAGGEPAPEDQKLTVQATEEKAFVGTASDHAVYQEFGTRYMKAQPYLRPAFEKIMAGATDEEIMKKYGVAAMKKEFKKRKKRMLNV